MYAEWEKNICGKYDFFFRVWISEEFHLFGSVRIYEYIWISFELINEFK